MRVGVKRHGGRLTAEGCKAIAFSYLGTKKPSRSPTPFSPDLIEVRAAGRDPGRGHLRIGRIGHGLGDEVGCRCLLRAIPRRARFSVRHGGAAAGALVVEAFRQPGPREQRQA